MRLHASAGLWQAHQVNRAALTLLACFGLLACDTGDTADEPSPEGGRGGGGNVTGGSGSEGGAATGGTTGDGGSYIPEPIPEISDEPPAPCQAAIDMGSPFQFLDDLCEAKRFPSYEDRDLSCPVSDPSATITLKNGGTVTYVPSSGPVEVDDEALVGIVPPELDV
ncbi:MAG: hypothetical protein JNK04_25900, partial [Myxococcales bacterium]|nr:hypothetical protein [Myxococcales bacterium]